MAFTAPDSAIIKVDFKSNNWAEFVCHGLASSSRTNGYSWYDRSLPLGTIYTNKNDAISKQTKSVLRLVPCERLAMASSVGGGGCGGGGGGIFF